MESEQSGCPTGKLTCQIDEEALERFSESLNRIFETLSFTAEQVGKALMDAFNKWADELGYSFDTIGEALQRLMRSMPDEKHLRKCPEIPTKLIHLAFHAKTKRKRNKNYSRVLKLWEEYNARNDTEQS